MNSVLVNQFAPTHLSINYDSTPVWGGNAETDVIYQEGFYSSEVRGIYWCEDVDGITYECDQGYIRIRGAGEYTAYTACHETGHAVGLTHGENAAPEVSNNNTLIGCMTSQDTNGLRDNNEENINNVYP